MLVFKKITYKNFLSTGNIANTIELDKHASTLITGKNGEGKSTILCALTFALFGKPFRNINKGQLINSINGKNCLVEIDFEVNGHQYIVKRGIKPNIFEIWCDGQMINQDAALKDYQKVLEQQIIKLNYKTFTQVVILGSATFVPFMQLPATQRREVIEDILDIKVFSVMNTILKEKAVAIKDQITTVEADLQNHQVKIQSQKKLIEALDQSRKDAVASLREKIETNNNAIAEAQGKIDRITDEIAAHSGVEDKQTQLSTALSKADKMKIKLSTTVDNCQHNIDFFNDHTMCPTCAQEIPEDHKQRVVSEIDEKIAVEKSKLKDIEDAVVKLTTQLQTANDQLDAIRDKSIEISTLRSTAKILKDQNDQLEIEASQVGQESANAADEKAKMKQYAEQAIDLVTRKSELLSARQLHDVAAALLKDTGIKTAIIREYLPVMNKLINKYLSAMDFFVKFELDESFQEVIKSRGRDAFTYDSFSEGEKRRLDLAILFTWRQIAKMKNSVNTNIMILDEILDGALDGAGIDFFLSMMNQFGENTNVFVISHKVDQMIDRFDHVIRVEKKNEFSVIASS